MSLPTPRDIERILVNASAEAHQLAQDWPAILAGIEESEEGVPASSYDGVRSPSPDNAAAALLAVERHRRDEAAAAKRQAQDAAMKIRDGYARLRDLYHYRRVGLPRDDSKRAPSDDEKALAEGESIDNDKLCQSCARITDDSYRHPGMKVCQWCWSIIKTYGPAKEGEDPGFGPRWPQLVWPPIELVTMHHEWVAGHRRRLDPAEVVRRLELSLGTPRKAPAT